MHRLPTTLALRDMLAAHGHDVLAGERREELHQLVRAVVDDLKALDWPPERVIVSVKQIAAESGLRPSPQFSRASQSLANDDALLARIVRWTIEEYYRDDSHHQVI